MNTQTDGVREELLLLRDLETQSHTGGTSAIQPETRTKRTGGFVEYRFLIKQTTVPMSSSKGSVASLP
ncbi:uncharacterized [Tachysurus ichikawai]